MNQLELAKRAAAMNLDDRRPIEKVTWGDEEGYLHRRANVKGCADCNDTGLVIDYIDTIGPTYCADTGRPADDGPLTDDGERIIQPKPKGGIIHTNEPGKYRWYAGMVAIDYCHCQLGFILAECSVVTFLPEKDQRWAGYGDHPKDHLLVPGVSQDYWTDSFTLKDDRLIEDGQAGD